MTRSLDGALRVVHLPHTFYPDPVGGTEVYVTALVQGLRKLGVDGIIAAPSRAPAVYSYDGSRVHRLAVSHAQLGLRELYGEGDPHVSAQFAELLDEEKLDVVHLHAFTSAISLRLVREAAQRGIPVVFTYHTPTVSCQRGTLMRWGKITCDGWLERRRCTQCTLHGLGLGSAASWAVGLLPPALVRRLGETGWQGSLWTALRMGELVALRHSAAQTLWKEVDGIIALCDWTNELLTRNGVSPAKITLSRHGLLRRGQVVGSPGRAQGSGQPLRLVYLGRLHPSKGVDLLVQAVRALPGVALELDLYGIVQGPGSDRYRVQLINLAGDDVRVRFHEPVPVESVRSTLERYDVLAAPSRGMETGPLVVFEAFDAGIPVLGSAVGGIGELVQHGINGLLVQPYDGIDAWTAALKALVTEPGLLGRLAAGVTPPRGIDDVAKEMLVVYGRVGVGSCLATS